MTLSIDVVTGTMPGGFDLLRNAARCEGYRFLERLAADWAAGTMRFDRLGVALLAVHEVDVLKGIGGLALDPFVPDARRMRRFYVHPAFRRRGTGRMLATALLARPSTAGRTITFNAGTVNAGIAQAPAFWAALGFAPDLQDGHTHWRCLAGLPGTG